MVTIDQKRNSISGCLTKASDAAPYVYNVLSAYVHLRLDYKDNPYKDSVKNKGEVYVIRCLVEDGTISNEDYTKLSPNYPPPCTGTGYVASPTYLIPEYCKIYDPNEPVHIEEGAIYCLDYDGKETLIAVFDPNQGALNKNGYPMGQFIDVSHFVSSNP